MRQCLVGSLVAVVLLAGCSGGSGSGPISTLPSQPPAGAPLTTESELSISTVNSVGLPLKSFATYATTTAPVAQLTSRSIAVAGDGACNTGSEFFAPDTNGDANSTESKTFYDTACTQLARDVVRVYTAPNGSSESVARTEKLFAVGNATAIAQNFSTEAISNATFDSHGFPIVATGFDRLDTGTLTIGNVRTIDADRELVMLPASGGSNAFCGDGASFNATGIPSLNETFGSQGSLSNGSRTVNPDGSVTWSSTHASTAFKGALGALSIATGSTPNATCPIATPLYTLLGGTATGTATIPVTATYKGGMLVSLTIANATLANGNTLSVATNSNVPPSSSQFVLGTIANGTTQIATFAVDAFGDGTLTVTKSGSQFTITDWHVIK